MTTRRRLQLHYSTGLVMCTSCGQAAEPGKLKHELLCVSPHEVTLEGVPATSFERPANTNTNANATEPHVDMATILIGMIDRFSLAERLRLAAHLVDDVKLGRSDRAQLITQARVIIGLVDRQLLEALKTL